MSCIFKIFRSKKVPERKPSFVIKINDPMPKTYEELVPYETFLRNHLTRLNRRYEVVSKNLAYARNQNEMAAILLAMRERREIEVNFEQIKSRLTEVVAKRKEFEGPAAPRIPRIPSITLEVVPNPLVTK